MMILHSKSRNQLKCRIRKGKPVVYANKLSLNIEKTSFVVFHSPQKRIAHKLNPSISNTPVKSDNKVKDLGLIFYSNLNWKTYLHELRFQKVLEYYLKLDIM